MLTRIYSGDASLVFLKVLFFFAMPAMVIAGVYGYFLVGKGVVETNLDLGLIAFSFASFALFYLAFVAIKKATFLSMLLLMLCIVAGFFLFKDANASIALIKTFV